MGAIVEYATDNGGICFANDARRGRVAGPEDNCLAAAAEGRTEYVNVRDTEISRTEKIEEALDVNDLDAAGFVRDGDEQQLGMTWGRRARIGLFLGNEKKNDENQERAKRRRRRREKDGEISIRSGLLASEKR